MPKILRKTEFGDAILRTTSERLSDDEIHSLDIRRLIEDMYYTLEHRKYGVGMAAPQVGRNVAISTIDTKPTPTRPDLRASKTNNNKPKNYESIQ